VLEKFIYIILCLITCVNATELSQKPMDLTNEVHTSHARVIRIADYIESETVVQSPDPVSGLANDDLPDLMDGDEPFGPRNLKHRERRTKEAVTFETCNGSGWAAVKERLLYSHADVIIAQEHRLLQCDIDEQAEIVKKWGWKSIWAPAIPTAEDTSDRRFTSAGVAVFARKHLGLNHLEENGSRSPPLEEGRLLATRFSAPGLGEIIVYAAYLKCGVGLDNYNKDILDKIRVNALQHGRPWIVGADWNLEPEVLTATDIPKMLKSKIIAPSEPTCISPAVAHVLDFFMIDNSLETAVKELVIVNDATTRPHKPVHLSLAAAMASTKVPKYRVNQRLPTERIIGPMRKPQDYHRAKSLAQLAKSAFADKDYKTGFDFYSRAFADFAGKAEIEVAHASDIMEIKPSSRAKKPARAFLPMVPNRKHVSDSNKVGKLNGALQNLQLLSAKMASAWKFGGKCWKTLAASIKHIVADVAANTEIHEWKEINDKINAHFEEVKMFAQLHGHSETTDLHGEHWQAYAAINCTAAAIRKDLSSGISEERSRITKKSNESWHEWRTKDLNAHAAGAHRFSKPARGWTPTNVTGGDGRTVLSPVDILDAEKARYSSLWNAAECPPDVCCADNVPLDKIDVDKLRRTSKSFKRKTGVAPDGWHPRHYSLISDEGLAVLSDLYELLEICGHLPNQQQQVFIFLVDKLSGGTRPIGLFTSMYRLWSKCRQGEAAKWAGKHDRPFFRRGQEKVYA